MKRYAVVAALFLASCGGGSLSPPAYDWHNEVPANAQRLPVPDEVYVAGLTAYAGDCKLIDKYRAEITKALGYEGWGRICG